jgi:hypothetical protein
MIRGMVKIKSAFSKELLKINKKLKQNSLQ